MCPTGRNLSNSWSNSSQNMLSDPLNGLYPPSILTSVLRTKTPRTIVQECSLSACSGHFHEAKSVPCEHQQVQGSTFFRSWHRAGLSQMFRVWNHLSRPGCGPQSCAHPASVPWMSGPPITLDGNSSGSFSFKRALLLPSLSLHPGTFKHKSGITLCRHSESEYV